MLAVHYIDCFCRVAHTPAAALMGWQAARWAGKHALSISNLAGGMGRSPALAVGCANVHVHLSMVTLPFIQISTHAIFRTR